MRADWRLWLIAIFGWAPAIVGTIVLTNEVRRGAGFQWYDIAFYGAMSLIWLAMAILPTAALIYEIWQNSDKGKSARQAEIEARFKEMEKYDENRLLEVLAEFGYQDQFNDLIKATKEGRLRWMPDSEFDDVDDGSADELGVTGFTTILHKNYTPEEIKNGSRQMLLLEIWLKEASGVYSLNVQAVTVFSGIISYGFCQKPTECGDKRVKELFDCVMQKHGKPQ